MPIYDYQCRKCSREFEEFQHMNARRLYKCPSCGHNALDRLIGTPALRTTTTFSAGRGTLLQQFGGDEAEVNRLVSEAKKQGYTPSIYDTYEPCIAQRKGDPAAFLPPSDPIGHLKKVCAKRRIGCEGRGVTIKSPPNNQPPRRKPKLVGAK
jgi:putative FmdB family regulatory protein